MRMDLSRTRHGCSYLSKAFGPADVLISEAEEALHGVEFDTFVGMGLSGALVIPLLARHFNKDLLIVRKPGERNHSFSKAEGFIGSRYVFVDDLIDSGETSKAVFSTIASLSRAKRVGNYLYGISDSRKGRFDPVEA